MSKKFVLPLLYCRQGNHYFFRLRQQQHQQLQGGGKEGGAIIPTSFDDKKSSDDNLKSCGVIMTISQFRLLLSDLQRARETIIDLDDEL